MGERRNISKEKQVRERKGEREEEDSEMNMLIKFSNDLINFGAVWSLIQILKVQKDIAIDVL